MIDDVDSFYLLTLGARHRVFSVFGLLQMETSFIRLSVELEVVRRACDVWDEARAGKVETNLLRQRRAVEENDAEGFHDLDYGFHKLICDLGGCALAVKTIKESKQKTDRLCTLSFGRQAL